MHHVLHDWDLDDKKMLLRKAPDALNPGGAVFYESFVNDGRSQNASGLMMSLEMLIETPGRFDCTFQDCIGWLAEVGFRNAYVEHLLGPGSMGVNLK